MSTVQTLPGIAILGAGIFPALAYIPALKSLGDSAPPLKAVYSRSEKSAAELSKLAGASLSLTANPDVYYDGEDARNLDTLLQRSDIAAVIIALPLTIQPDIVIKCLDAGKHVLSEKPVAATVLKGLSLIKDASKYVEKGLVWRVAENYEAEPVYRKAGKILNSGTIGSVSYFKASVVNYIDQSSPWYNTPWRTNPEYPGGFLLDGGVHTTAALRTLLPRPLSQLSGFASLNKDYLAPHDTIHTIVRAGSHFHGTVDMTWAWPTKSKPIQEEMVITGTKGWLGIGRIEGGWRITVKILLNEKPESYEEKEENLEFTSQGVAQEFLQFFNVIRGERGLDIGKPLDALRDVAFIQAALTSDGNPVSLEDLVQE